MEKNYRKKRKGFTLVELLIVIVIVGVLATVTVISINPQGRMAGARDNQREVHGSAIWHAIEEKIFSEGDMVGCDDLPASETKISSANYNLYTCIYPEYLSQAFYDPTEGYFNNVDNYDTGYYIAIDAYGNPYFKAGHGETREITIGTEPEFAIKTNSATSVGSTSGSLNGELYHMGDATTADVWFDYGTTDALELGTVGLTNISAAESFSYFLTGLTSETRYYFRAFGKNADDAGESSQGMIRSFLTE